MLKIRITLALLFSNPSRTADELKVKSKQYIENLEWQDIKTLLRYSSNPQQIINLLLLNKLFVVRLNLKELNIYFVTQKTQNLHTTL